MRYRKNNLLVVLLLLFINTPASSSTKNLCDSEQNVFVSAETTDGKLISFCTSLNENDNPVKLQYRYGKPGKIEMQYPKGYAELKKLDNNFDIEDYEKPLADKYYQANKILLMHFPFAGGGGMLLSFKNKNYIYHYYSALIKVDMKTHQEIEYLDVYKVGQSKPITQLRTTKDGTIIKN